MRVAPDLLPSLAAEGQFSQLLLTLILGQVRIQLYGRGYLLLKVT